VRLLLGVLLVSSLVSPSGARAADETEESLLGGFSPYVWAGPYTTIQRAKASVDTDFGPQDKTANTLTNLGWLFQLGVQSPEIGIIPGSPRLDASGGLLVPTNQSSAIGSRVELITGTFLDKTREETKLSLDYNNSYRATLALEFTIEDFLPVDFSIAPGAQYLYLDSRWEGLAESERTFPGGLQDPVLRGARTKVNFVQHLFGPSLRLSTAPVDVFGMVQVDVYAEGALLFDLEGTRRTRSLRDAENRRSTFNWETGSTAGLVSLGLRIRLP
jgi:hypothetical protein